MPEISYEVDDAEVQRLLEEIPDDVNRASVTAVKKTLDAIENAQIKTYTNSAKPAQPSGSTYVRTFRLKGSSKRKNPRNVKNRSSAVEGVWWSEGVDYASLVIGTRQQQAGVHAGRWKSLETVADEGQKALARFMGEEIQKIKGVT